MIARAPRRWTEVDPATVVTVWSRSHSGSDSPFVRERSYPARYAMRWHDLPHASREYRVFARDYDPTVADVSTARAHALRVGCEHCGGYAVGRADGPYFTGCGCTVPSHGRILEPAR